MAYERRLYPRSDVNWTGHATFTDGPQLSVRVLDVSAGGARLEVQVTAEPQMREILELTAFKRNSWLFGHGRPVTAMGRIVRIGTGSDRSNVEVAVRFHTPLREDTRAEVSGFPLQWAFGTRLAPSA